jgi:chemotaxis protein MotB
MARKKLKDEPDNHDRWMVSYADFITLLLAFFVVMYAISSVNAGKYRVLSDSLGSAFGRATPVTPATKVPIEMSIGGQSRLLSAQKHDLAVRREKEHMTDMAREILKVLAPLVNQGKVRVSQNSRGINVEINASVLFAPGEAKLTNGSGQALRAVALVLKNDKHAIQVEGYTDNVSISNSMFPSNWELSAVRASSVVRLLAENGIDESRLIAVGHGANEPVSANDNAEGRSRNRRVEVMILSGVPDVVKDVPVSSDAVKSQ